MNVQWFLVASLVILHCIQVSPLNTDRTSKSASPGQVIELLLNVVNFANEVKKKLTDAPTTVINIAEGTERARKKTEGVKFKRSTRNLMMVGGGVNESVKNEEYGRRSLLERVVGWALEQSDGAKSKVVDVRNCIRGKEQELVNVEKDVRLEIQKCFSLSQVSGEAQQAKNLSVEKAKNFKGDVEKGYLPGEERKQEKEDTVLRYIGDDLSARVDYGESTEELMKVLLKGQNIDLGGEMVTLYKDHEKEGEINSDEMNETKMIGKNNSKIPFMVEEDKKLSEVLGDNSKTFPRSTRENVRTERNVSASDDLGSEEGACDTEQRTKEDGRTPKEADNGGIKSTTTPPVPNVELRTTQTSAPRSSPSNATCVALAIQTGRQKIDDIVREINNCFLQ